MSFLTRRFSHKIDIGFVLTIMVLFAITTFSLVLIGAKQYKGITSTIDENHEERTASSYLAEKFRSNNVSDAISICELNGVTALSIITTENDISYITYIYHYDNYLYELVVTENSVFSLSSGQKIIEMQDFNLTYVNESLIKAEITNSSKEKQTLFFDISCNAGKEQS